MKFPGNKWLNAPDRKVDDVETSDQKNLEALLKRGRKAEQQREAEANAYELAYEKEMARLGKIHQELLAREIEVAKRESLQRQQQQEIANEFYLLSNMYDTHCR